MPEDERVRAVAAAIYTSMYGADAAMPRWVLVGDGCRERFHRYAAAALEVADRTALHIPPDGPPPGAFLPYADRLNAEARAFLRDQNEHHFGPGPNKFEPGRGD